MELSQADGNAYTEAQIKARPETGLICFDMAMDLGVMGRKSEGGGESQHSFTVNFKKVYVPL